eukprot:362568-Chlamydomonas_euryale.AAC.2
MAPNSMRATRRERGRGTDTNAMLAEWYSSIDALAGRKERLTAPLCPDPSLFCVLRSNRNVPSNK